MEFPNVLNKFVEKIESRAYVNLGRFKVPAFPISRKILIEALLERTKFYQQSLFSEKKISEFIYDYEQVRDCLIKLSMFPDQGFPKIPEWVRGELSKLQKDAQDNLRDTITRVALDIANEYHGVFKYEKAYIHRRILNFREEIEAYSNRMDSETQTIAATSFHFLCLECDQKDLLPPKAFLVPRDINLYDAINTCFDFGNASPSIVARFLKIDYTDAINTIEEMERIGIIGTRDEHMPGQFLLTRSDALKLVLAPSSLWDAEPKDIRIPARWDVREKLNLSDKEIIEQSIQAEDAWRREQVGLPPAEYVLSQIDKMSGIDFEKWTAKLLKMIGYEDVELTSVSGDQGADILATKDGVRYAFQCKRYHSDLGNTPVQEVNAAVSIYKCHVGVVVTNRYFTSGAIEAAAPTGIILWDRDKLTELIKYTNIDSLVE